MLLGNKWPAAMIVYETDQGSGGNPPVGDNGGTPPVGDSQGPSTQGDDDAYDKDRAMQTIRHLKGFEKQAKDLQKQLDALTAAEKSRQDQEMSAVDRATQQAKQAQQDRDAMEAKYKSTLINNAIRFQAIQSGFVDPEDAVSLIDRSSIDLDDQDQVQGVKQAVGDLAKAKPHLVRTNRPNAPDINATTGGGPPTTTVETVIANKKRSGDYAPF